MSQYVRLATRLDKPLAARLGSLVIELTERCDNNCIHCSINLPQGDSIALAREMTTQQVKDVLVQAAGLGCLRVRLTGGEPLLRPDFPDIYLFARRLGMKVCIFTNARRITEGLAELLANVPPLIPLEVSVYGMRQESYEAVSRAPGSYAEFRRGVALLLQFNVPFIVKGALLPPNRTEVEEFEGWAATIPWMKRRPAYSMCFGLRERRDCQTKNRQIAALRVAPKEVVRVMARDPDAYRAFMVQFAAKFLAPADDRLFTCTGIHGLSIDAYGRAQPCMGVRAPELTVDVLEGCLLDALNRFARYSELRAMNLDYLSRCAVCSIKGLCEQCPAKSWTEHGALDRPVEYSCEVAHAQARWLGWLGEHECGWNTCTDS